MTWIPDSGGLGMGLSLGGVPIVPCRINFDYFFDRPAIKNALSKTKYYGLYKSGSEIRKIAHRSIIKMGLAKPKLKVMERNPGTPLKTLIAAQKEGSKRREKLRQRLVEIQAKPQSLPGTPPHTHTGIFRRDIKFAYDKMTESVVIGQTMAGGAWLAALHEFGGTEQLRGWAWIPRWEGSYRTGIIGYWRVGRRPKRVGRWEQTSFTRTANYPARPYMKPAGLQAIAEGKVEKSFAGNFRVGGL